MNEYVGASLIILLWLSFSYLLFRIIKRKYKKKPFNIKEFLDKQQRWSD